MSITVGKLGTEESDAPAKPAELNIPIRAVMIGALAVALTAVVVTQAEMVLSSVHVGYMQLPPVAIGLLLLVIAFNTCVKAISRRFGLASSELLLIYCMILVAAMVSSHGIVEKWIPALVAMKYDQNANNHWHNLFDPSIPSRLVPYDPRLGAGQSVATAYYEGMNRGGSVPWSAWIVPLLSWGLLIGLIVFSFLCLTTILRKQWVENEKLSFPLAQLPLEIGGDEGQRSILRNPIMWLGALGPVVVYGIKGLHQAFPVVPDITLQYNLSDYVTMHPYDEAAQRVFFIVSFAAIGFFYLLPQDILFSIWFFFLLTHVEQLVAVSFNMDTPGMSIYPPTLMVGYQTIGAYLVLTGYYFWSARAHLSRVWASAIGDAHVDDSRELMPYRVAVWGLLGSILASSVWLWTIGMSIWLALFELVIFIFVTAVVLARSTAEAGMLMTETTFRPIDIYRMFAPIHSLGASNLTALAFFDTSFLNDQRGLLLTGLMDAARISDGTRYRRRSFFGVLVAAIGLALVIAVLLNIAIPYHIGASQMDPYMEQAAPTNSFRDYAPYFGQGQPLISGGGWQMPAFCGVGIVMTVFLTVMRTGFVWWPLHPLGYALSGSWSTVQFWFPCLIAWALKSVSMRYGGLSFYRKARPFFLGLVVGEFGMAVLFVLLNILSAWLTPDAKISPPQFPWG
jgi:hypothetical protein